jgi:hypothetical protein
MTEGKASVALIDLLGLVDQGTGEILSPGSGADGVEQVVGSAPLTVRRGVRLERRRFGG